VAWILSCQNLSWLFNPLDKALAPNIGLRRWPLYTPPKIPRYPRAQTHA
jgi:hypothetical protein